MSIDEYILKEKLVKERKFSGTSLSSLANQSFHEDCPLQLPYINIP